MRGDAKMENKLKITGFIMCAIATTLGVISLVKRDFNWSTTFFLIAIFTKP